MVLLSAALTYFFSPWWLLFTCFIGVNLIQSAITGFCPAARIIRALGLAKGNCGCELPEKNSVK